MRKAGNPLELVFNFTLLIGSPIWMQLIMDWNASDYILFAFMHLQTAITSSSFNIQHRYSNYSKVHEIN